MTDTRKRMLVIFKNVFDDDEIEWRDELTADEVEDWDSLHNVKMMVQAEQEFGIEFTTGEVAELKDVGTLIAMIDQKRSD